MTLLRPRVLGSIPHQIPSHPFLLTSLNSLSARAAPCWSGGRIKGTELMCGLGTPAQSWEQLQNHKPTPHPHLSRGTSQSCREPRPLGDLFGFRPCYADPELIFKLRIQYLPTLNFLFSRPTRIRSAAHIPGAHSVTQFDEYEFYTSPD